MTRRSARRRACHLCLMAALGCLLFGAVELVSWSIDRARLRSLALTVSAPARDEAERMVLLTDWISRLGPRKQRLYHLWRRLDATPVQVLEQHGGNCEDKSKLLVAMLRELDIDGSLLMLSACEQCKATHTVAIVETRGGWTLADPVYNITFPDGRGGLRTIEELRADPALLERRLAELRAERGPAQRINRYKSTDHYAHMTTVNWNKNALTRGAAALVRAAGAEPWSLPRPLFLDDPKQFFLLLGFGGALGFFLLALLLRPGASRGTARAIVPEGWGTDAAAHSQSKTR